MTVLPFDPDAVGRRFGEEPPVPLPRRNGHAGAHEDPEPVDEVELQSDGFDEIAAQQTEARATDELTPSLTVHGDLYRLSWRNGISAELERFSEHRDELTVELTVTSSRPPRPRLLHSARFNLTSTRARTELARALTKRLEGLEWDELIERMCFLVRERYREGDPAIDMRHYVAPAAARWLVDPYVERARPTVLFADGGSGKSVVAIGICVSAATGRSILGQLRGDPVAVLYVDFEADAGTFAERLDAILAGAAIQGRPPIFYRRASASLVESAPALRREVAERGIGLLVIDSLGTARNGEPESADLTIRLFNAVRSLEVPWLGIDHVTKANGNSGSRPFGSTYTHNLAGLTWGLDVAHEDDTNAISIALTNHKRNAGRRLPRRGLRIEFDVSETDELRAVRFRHQDPADNPELATRLPLRQRVLAELRGGPLAVDELAGELAVDEKQVRSRVGEMVRRRELVRLEDRRVAVAAKGQAS